MVIRKAVMICLVIISFCLNGCAGKNENKIVASGNIEATEIQVAAETAGRLLTVNAGEGNKINEGDLLAKVDASAAVLKLKEAEAMVQAAEAGLRDMKTGARRQEVTEVMAAVEQAQAKKQAALVEASNASKEWERIKELYNAGAVSEQELDRLSTLHEVSQVKLYEAEANLEAARARADMVRSGAARRRSKCWKPNLSRPWLQKN
jgi:HlyD family secretion protein